VSYLDEAKFRRLLKSVKKARRFFATAEMQLERGFTT
jgi:hypothetical protein